jgi:hypothetical protein
MVQRSRDLISHRFDPASVSCFQARQPLIAASDEGRPICLMPAREEIPVEVGADIERDRIGSRGKEVAHERELAIVAADWEQRLHLGRQQCIELRVVEERTRRTDESDGCDTIR